MRALEVWPFQPSLIIRLVFGTLIVTTLEECGKKLREPERLSVSRPESYRPLAYERPRVEVSKRLATGGVLLVVAGIMGMLLGAIIPSEMSSSGLSNWIEQNSDLPVLFACFAFAGGILALLRRLFYIALFLSIIDCFSVGPFFMSSILPTIGTILLAVSRRDFVPVFTKMPEHSVGCPSCNRPLEYTPLYKEWYCFNCKQYRELEPQESYEKKAEESRSEGSY